MLAISMQYLFLKSHIPCILALTAFLASVCTSGIAKGLDGYVPTQISLGMWRPLPNAIMNKKRVVHTLAVSYFHCKSTADIEISVIITLRDLSSSMPSI